MKEQFIIPFDRDPTYGIDITLCGNAQFLGIDTTSLPYTSKEAVQRVLEAAACEIYRYGLDYDVDYVHAHWAGGSRGNGQHSLLDSALVDVQVYRRTAYEDDDGEMTFSPWNYCTGPLPQFILKEAIRIQADIEAEMYAELNQLAAIAESRLKKKAKAEAEAEAEKE